eukprot:2172993-Prymnesium_polylepis.1
MAGAQISPALAAASAAMHGLLSRMARSLLCMLAGGLAVPAAAFLDPLDPASAAELPEGALTSS